MICSKCGSNIPDDSKFCVYCGSKVEKAAVQAPETPEKKICPGCGAELRAGAKFCTKCGMKQEAQPASQAASQHVSQPAPQAASQHVSQPAPQPASQHVSQPAPKPASQPAPSDAPAAKKGGKKAPVILGVILLLIALVIGTGFVLDKFFDINLIAVMTGASEEDPDDAEEDRDDAEEGQADKESSEETEGNSEDADSQNSPSPEQGDASLLEPVDELAAQVKTEYENQNYFNGVIPLAADALTQYAEIGEEQDLKEEAQKGIDSVYGMYVDSVARVCEGLKGQGAYAPCVEQVRLTTKDAEDVTEMLTEKGYTVNSEELFNYKAEILQWYKDLYIKCINDITKYENWSRDEAWNYAEGAYFAKEDGKPILFDEEEPDDPLRMRYVYCLAWKTRKACETGLADGTMTKESAAQSMIAILEETDYNLLLLQDIITYGSEAGMDVAKYRDAYNAVVEQIKSGQNLTVSNSTGVSSATSVDLQHFWYFNDLDGEDAYKVDQHNGTTAATREWIRSNVPVILNE